MHYIIVIGIIVIIVIVQIRFFIDTNGRITNYLDIFPEQSNDYNLEKDVLIKHIDLANEEELIKMLSTVNLDSERYYRQEFDDLGNLIPVFRQDIAKNDLINNLSNNGNGISVNHDNATLFIIITAINNYLKSNNNVSDFHLMKDIVDRNCDAKEEEINTQIPIPLYMGLVGTMAGILIGILYLWLSGGIGDLLSAGGGSGAEGVEALLGGVALAMISSILGIVLTTWGSNKFKTAKSQVESKKHFFLSWIQAKLLPILSENVAGVIREMSSNLTNFNKQFSDNTSNLSLALAKVNESYRLQTQLIDTVNKIQEGRTAATNLTLLSKLIESSEQIGKLGEYLHNTNDYLTNVRALNDKLDASEQRTKAIEDMAVFFKDEISQIDQRKQAISLSVGKIDDYFQQSLEKLKNNTDQSILELQKSAVKQQEILQQKTAEISKIVVELNNLTEVKKSISGFENAIKSQNSKLDNLTNAIFALAKNKGGDNSGMTTSELSSGNRKSILSIIKTSASIVIILLLSYIAFVIR